MTKFADIPSYHAAQDAEDRRTCDVLKTAIDRALPEAESRVWHGHPVWFLDGNPIVGYHRLKHSMRVLFWSGQSFSTPGLTPEGSFKAAEVRFSSADEIDADALASWLEEARTVQWNYRDIRTNRGVTPLVGVGPA